MSPFVPAMLKMAAMSEHKLGMAVLVARAAAIRNS